MTTTIKAMNNYYVAYITPDMLHRIHKLLAKEQHDREQRRQAYYEKGLAKTKTEPKARVVPDYTAGFQIVGSLKSNGSFTPTVAAT